MVFFIGTDEAGYGPNLGPLVVGLSAWSIPGEDSSLNLEGRLAGCVADSETLNDPCRIPLADSKQLYQPARGLSLLEQAALAAWSVAGILPTTVQQVWPYFTMHSPIPAWHREWESPLPLHQATPSFQSAWRESLQAGLKTGQVSLQTVQARIMHPLEFNQLVTQHNSKGTVLSEATLLLVRDFLESLSESDRQQPAVVLCDKHGGRDRYAALLQHLFPDHSLQILNESRPLSSYRLTHNGVTSEFRFQSRGEAYIPTALASMTAKYLRELSMHAFNDFWLRHQPGLKPTAGYPQDAVRFRKEIAATQQKLGISEDELWRVK